MAESGDLQPSAAEAARWLAKAEEDLAVAELLVQTESPVRWAACFHGQQAAEKAIKSLLVLAGVDFPRSHALDGLVALLPEDMRSHFDDEALVVLQPWAIAGRYPEDIGEPDASTTTWIVELAGRGGGGGSIASPVDACLSDGHGRCGHLCSPARSARPREDDRQCVRGSGTLD